MFYNIGAVKLSSSTWKHLGKLQNVLKNMASHTTNILLRPQRTMEGAYLTVLGSTYFTHNKAVSYYPLVPYLPLSCMRFTGLVM
jgi:hypothetical protein